METIKEEIIQVVDDIAKINESAMFATCYGLNDHTLNELQGYRDNLKKYVQSIIDQRFAELN